MNQIESLCRMTVEKLKTINADMRRLLDETAITQYPDCPQSYLSDVLDAIRTIYVHSKESEEHLSILLKGKKFLAAPAERILYELYHRSILEFFSPMHDVWQEDGRYSYTGKDAIDFRDKVPPHLREGILRLAKSFETLREELLYYETDYMTKEKMKKQS